MADALFTRDSDGSGAARYTPSELCRGPWSPHALHGGPVAALLAHLASEVEQPGPMHPARLTLELLRPVPLAPLAPRARILRPGRKVQLVEASLFADGAAGNASRGGGQDDEPVEVARATVLFVRRAEQPLPAEHGGGPTAPPSGPRGVARTRAPWGSRGVAYHSHAVEHRVVRGDWAAPGPCTDWMRLRVPLLADAPLSPFERVAAVADFGNGISTALPYGEWRFINPDLTVHLQRLPRGELVCLDATTWPESGGMGLAESELYDEAGRIGRALQSLLLEKA